MLRRVCTYCRGNQVSHVLESATLVNVMTDPSSSIKALAQLLQHQFKILDDALLKVSHDKNEEGGDETTLNQLVANPDLSSAVFPVYGVVKAGKSTFFACLIGEKVLPEQAAPMTSIPIRIKHVKGIPQKRLIMPQYERWNRCVAGFRQKLLSGTLDAEILDPSRKGESNGGGNDVALFKIQEEIRAKKVSFCAEATGDAIRVSADAIRYSSGLTI